MQKTSHSNFHAFADVKKTVSIIFHDRNISDGKTDPRIKEDIKYKPKNISSLLSIKFQNGIAIDTLFFFTILQ